MTTTSSYQWNTDSISSIESSCCRERKHFEHQLSKLRSENASLSNAVQRLTDTLKVKEEKIVDMEDAIVDMQQTCESKMLEMLKTKLSDNTSASCPCRHGISSSASDLREESKDEEGPSPSSKSPAKRWWKTKSGVSCGLSVLSKIKTTAALRSIPKFVTITDTSEIDNMSSLTYKA